MVAFRVLIPLSAMIAGASLVCASPMPVQVAEARGGMVSSGHPQASEAGVAVLRAGGNAVDAGVAVALCLGVAEPYGSGMGGKLVLTYYSASERRVWSLEALDEAPAALTGEQFREADAETRGTGALSVAVPGLPAGLAAAHGRWGRKSWSSLVAPAIRLAREGFEVTPPQVRFFRAQEAKLKARAEAARIFLPEGRTVQEGQVLVQRDLASTLELFSRNGHDGFYRGPVAEAIVATLREQGSPVTLADFEGFKAVISEPLHVRFQGYDIYSAPPPVSGGGVYLLTLAVLGDRTLPGKALSEPEAMDHVMRTFLEADSAAREVLGDREGARESYLELLGPDSLARLRGRVGERRAEPAAVAAGRDGPDAEALAAETTHFVVVDREGNLLSVTQSQSLHFGSAIIAPGTGVVLNNSLSNFNRVRGNVNEVSGGRRPRSTITPTIVLKDGSPRMALGLPGGSRIPSTMVQVTVDALGYDRPLEDAIGAPRFHPNSRGSGTEGPGFETERETDYRLTRSLVEKFGWRDLSKEDVESFGGVNAIELLPDGRIRGYADQRRSNRAMGY